MIKESGSKEVELHEDDPAAVFGLLRYIYDLPYYSGSSYDDDERWNNLVPHAELFVAAEKYQVLGLQCEICSRLHNRIENWLAEGELPNVDDFVRALRKVVAQASDDNRLRGLMVRTCATNLRELQDVTEFLSLLKEFGSLGADIIGHKDLERGLVGAWMCTKDCTEDGPPVCSTCGKYFPVERAWASRHQDLWWCSHCDNIKRPVCSECDVTVEWTEGREMLR
jgi:hypothetical protein